MTAIRRHTTDSPPLTAPGPGAAHPGVVSDSQWLEHIFRANCAGVYTIARRVLRSDADSEDVTQTSFIRALSARSSLRDPERTRPWLLRIAYREAIAVLRRRRDLPTDPGALPQPRDTEPGPEECAMSEATAERVRKAIEALPGGLAAAVVLRDLHGLPMSEVAEILGVGLSAAKMRVHRGRTLLKVQLHADVRVA